MHERHHADNNKSAERGRNIVDSNKLQTELESNTPASQIVPQTVPSSNTTSPLKSRIHNIFVKTKRIFYLVSRKRMLKDMTIDAQAK